MPVHVVGRSLGNKGNGHDTKLLFVHGLYELPPLAPALIAHRAVRRENDEEGFSIILFVIDSNFFTLQVRPSHGREGRPDGNLRRAKSGEFRSQTVILSEEQQVQKDEKRCGRQKNACDSSANLKRLLRTRL